MRFPFISKIFFFLACGLFIIAFFLRVLFSDWDFTSLFYLLSFFICFFISLILDIKGYYEVLTLKSTKHGLTYVGGILLILTVFVAINYGVSYISWKKDLSQNSVYTLTAFSKSIARSFSEPVEFLYLEVPNADSKDMELRIRGAIRLFLDENTQFSFKKINLLMHPEFTKNYKLNEQESALFVRTKDRHERFYKTDENGITQSLLRLLKGRKTIYFSVGQGEQSIFSDKSRGLMMLKKEVERLFYDVQEINLNSELLPANAAGVIVLGPERDLPERVQNKLYEYYESGGRLFVAFDPLNNVKANTFLNRFGIALESGIVHQEQSLIANLGSHVITGLVSDQKHPVLADMESVSPVMFYVTGSLIKLKSSSDVKTLLQSPKTAMLRDGFTKQDKLIREGVMHLFMQLSGKNGGEIFVAADSDIFANQFLYQHANPQFMFNLFSYMSKDEDLIGKKQTKPTQQFLITDLQLKIYIGLFIIPLPILLFSAGIFLWFRRRWL